jgi:hypothetical protein
LKDISKDIPKDISKNPSKDSKSGGYLGCIEPAPYDTDIKPHQTATAKNSVNPKKIVLRIPNQTLVLPVTIKLTLMT